jgi:YD repeat-containing protein
MGQVATKTLSVVSEQRSGTSPSGSLTVSYGYGGPTTFTYTLDALERPTALTDSTNYTWATGALYNPANQITNATLPSGTETWVYNTLNQLYQRTTTSGSTTRMNMTYTYTAGKNNGQIASSADAVTGETVAYQYDSLKRLAGATSTPLPPVNGTAWSEAYAYDGFGNLTAMSGNGSPPLSVSVNPATNQFLPSNVFNVAYDGNGNVTQFGPSGSLTNLTYDVSNRLATVNSSNNAYAYSSNPPDPPDPPEPPPPPPPPPPPTPADPTPPTGPPSFELEAIGACVYPHGVGVTAVTGMLQLDITYQLLENDQPIFGNDTLNSLGAAVFENVTVTSGQPIDANGQWCPAFSSLCSPPGTMDPHGDFSDLLAANPQGPSTANQSFSYYMKGGQYILPVINFPGMPSVLQNAYSSTSISVSNGAVVGNSKTQLCPGA